jgi:uncharacterized protein (TIGR03435 family)
MRGGFGAAGDQFDDPTRPTIFTVFERQLGLKMEPTRARTEVYVIRARLA